MRVGRTRLELGLFIAGFAAQIVPPLPSRTGSVTGVVRTPGGVPVSNVRVTALRAEMMDDAFRAMASLAQTDSSGRYLLENVPPGRYYITAGRVDLPTYYPGTLEMVKGTTISITSAGTISDIDFVIQDLSAAPPPGPPGLRGRGVGPLVVVPGANSRAGQGGRRGPAAPSPPSAATPVPSQTGNVLRRAVPSIFASQSGAAWWTDDALVARLGLTENQRKTVQAVAEQHRQTLAQNKSHLDKEEAALARMLDAEILEPARIIAAQSERVVQARAELERTNSKLTLEIRENLTRSQWAQLQKELVRPSPATPSVLPGGRSRSGMPGTP